MSLAKLRLKPINNSVFFLSVFTASFMLLNRNIAVKSARFVTNFHLQKILEQRRIGTPRALRSDMWREHATCPNDCIGFTYGNRSSIKGTH